jgi:hypothetical protein
VVHLQITKIVISISGREESQTSVLKKPEEGQLLSRSGARADGLASWVYNIDASDTALATALRVWAHGCGSQVRLRTETDTTDTLSVHMV